MPRNCVLYVDFLANRLLGGGASPPRKKSGDAVSPRLRVDTSPNGVMRKEDSAVSCMVSGDASV